MRSAGGRAAPLPGSGSPAGRSPTSTGAAVRSRANSHAVQHHREHVDADRSHEEAVAVEGELQEHQASFWSRAPATSRAPSRPACRPMVPSRSARRRSNSSPYPARSVRASPPSSTTVRPSPCGVILAQNRRRRTVSEHSSPASSSDREHQRGSLAGVVADLQVDPLAARRRSARRCRRRGGGSGRAAGSPCATFTSAPESTLAWSTAKMDWPRPSSRPRSPRSTSTATSGSFARREHRGDDVAAGRGGRQQPGDRQPGGLALRVVGDAGPLELRGALRQHRGEVDRAPLDGAGALLPVRERHGEPRRVAVPLQVDAVAVEAQRVVDRERERPPRGRARREVLGGLVADVAA